MAAYAVKQGFIHIELDKQGLPKDVVINMDANYDDGNTYCDNENPLWETSIINYCPWCGGRAMG